MTTYNRSAVIVKSLVHQENHYNRSDLEKPFRLRHSFDSVSATWSVRDES